MVWLKEIIVELEEGSIVLIIFNVFLEDIIDAW